MELVKVAEVVEVVVAAVEETGVVEIGPAVVTKADVEDLVER